MSIPSTSTTATQAFTISGTTYDYTGKYYEATDLTVSVRDSSAGTTTELTRGTHYTLYEGAVTLTSTVAALYAGKTLVVSRNLPLTQEVDLPTTGAIDTESLEEALDRSILIAQEHDERLSRTLAIPQGEAATEEALATKVQHLLNLSELTVSATTGAEGSSASATIASDKKSISFTIPKGDTGATGPQGDKGDPGTTTFAGLTDSPMNNAQLAAILNAKAETSALTSHTGDSSIHVTSSDKTAWNAKYDKPSDGIPKTDLASAVQTSLGKADTALQTEAYTGTLTGITMNGESMGTSGVVDLGTVITAHQDISGKADASALTSHTSNTSIHVTSSDKTAWDGKQDAHSVASGSLLKSGGTGVIGAATAGTDYMAAPGNAGTTGQYLRKTASGHEWETRSEFGVVSFTRTSATRLAFDGETVFYWDLVADSTLSFDVTYITDFLSGLCFGDCPILINPHEYSVTSVLSGRYFEFVDSLVPNALNHCVIRMTEDHVSLFVVHTEAEGTITTTATTITGVVNTAMAIDISDYVTVSTGASPSFAVASGSTLPAGLTLGSDGYLEGTPTATSSAVVSVTVSARMCTTATLVLTFSITSGGGTVSYVYNSSSYSGSYNNGTYVYDSATNTAVCESTAAGDKRRLAFVTNAWLIQVYSDGVWSSPSDLGDMRFYGGGTATSDISCIVGTLQWYNNWEEMNEYVTVTQQ